jgi:hypothetical protein
MSTNGLGDPSTGLQIFQRAWQPSSEEFSAGDFFPDTFREAKGGLDLR